MAMVARRLGLDVLLVDAGTHPRFAIGESSTPAADLLLESLATRFQLDDLLPLARYGRWKRAYPEIDCGCKRGFSYFYHEPQQPFGESRPGVQSLLVAASASDQVADTHWMRSDTDAFFVRQAAELGIPCFLQTQLTAMPGRRPWRWRGRTPDEPLEVQAELVIDATGAAGAVPRALGLHAVDESGFQTRSQATFGHFQNVQPWSAELARSSPDSLPAHPFDCDAAALHHFCVDGWMWQLRFDSQIVSCGVATEFATGRSAAAEESEWDRFLARYPSVQNQFHDARLVAPGPQLVRTGRLQRQWDRCGGSDWLLLPSTAGFIDPLHSTGIAHNLAGIERIAELLASHWKGPGWEEAVTAYERKLQAEFRLMDMLVAGCYRARGSFRLLTSYLMVYFAAATSWEAQRVAGRTQLGFLLADDPAFTQLVTAAWAHIRQMISEGGQRPSRRDEEDFERWLQRELAPFNSVGLCNPNCQNMYRHTAADKSSS